MTQFTDLERERPSRLSEASLRINESLEFGDRLAGCAPDLLPVLSTAEEAPCGGGERRRAA